MHQPGTWIGLTDLYTEQGIIHLLILLHHGHCTNDLTGQLIQRCLENMHLEIGFSGPIFVLPYDDLHQLATMSWVKVGWQFQQMHNIQIKTDTPDLKISHTNNQLLMPAFYSVGFCRDDLSHLNQCHIYLQIMPLADLCNGLGFYLNLDMWTGQTNTTFNSGYTWPRQPRPTKQDRICWQIAIQSTFQFSFLHQLVCPLGQWLTSPFQA